MQTRLVLLGALLTPALAFAQPPDPYAQPQPPPPPPPTVVVDPPPPTVTVEAPPPTVTVTPMSEPEYEEVYDSYNAPMFTSGALVFAASYGASVVVAASSDDERGNHHLYVPVVGPWLALNDRGDCDITSTSCDSETTKKVLLVADGVFQAAGVVGMISGLLQPTSHRRVVRAAKVDTKVHIKPSFSSGPGVSMFGRF
jgi:hypothetical protein